VAFSRESLAEDVAAASASVLLQLWPEITLQGPQEVYDRLKAHLNTVIRAYCDGLQGWEPASEKRDFDLDR
jgi:hypothetical protein